MTGTNAHPSVAPTFGVEGMFGTKPLTIGIPTDEDFDFLIDCASSITQNGKVEYYERIGEHVHPGTIICQDGQSIEGDAGAALKVIRNGTAALATLGGIGEALDGKDADGNKTPYHLGHFFIAIDTNHFLGEELCRKKAGDIIRSVRNSKKAPGAERIYSAGEKEYFVRLARKDGVPINESVQKEIISVRDELGFTQYKFPWED